MKSDMSSGKTMFLRKNGKAQYSSMGSFLQKRPWTFSLSSLVPNYQIRAKTAVTFDELQDAHSSSQCCSCLT